MAKKQIKPVGNAKNAELIAEETTDALAEYAANALVAVEQLRIKSKPVEGLLLNEDERAVLAKVPGIAAQTKRKLAKSDASFTVVELIKLVLAATEAFMAAGGNQKAALLLVVKKLVNSLEANIVMPAEPVKAKKPKSADLLYQFKITLKESQPPIWRRIQVKDCTLDKLHEHIQTAMGWTNSHLHHFKLGEEFYGDRMLLGDNFREFGYHDSTTTKLSDILPKTRKRFAFLYEYDFGDSWNHEVLFEGVVPPDTKVKYPLCVEGARACPPDDCGGIWGYPDFVEAIQNPAHEQHEELLEWVGGRFDPEDFDPAAATKAMKKGLPDWRRMAGL